MRSLRAHGTPLVPRMQRSTELALETPEMQKMLSKDGDYWNMVSNGPDFGWSNKPKQPWAIAKKKKRPKKKKTINSINISISRTKCIGTSIFLNKLVVD